VTGGAEYRQYPVYSAGNTGYGGPTAINQLADRLVMDRTTLTRNLRLLTGHGWVRINSGEDRRTRIVALTAAGEGALMRALPLWKQAQAHMVGGMG
jgi:DNA-binding MarR family transcriptional regulator